MPYFSRLTALLGLVLVGGWPGLSWAQGADVTNFKVSEDYIFVCKSDAALYRCLEVLDRDSGNAEAQASVYYFELDWSTFEARGLSCAVDSGGVSISTDGRFLRDASLNVTLVPESAECAGSWGEWSPDPRVFSVALSDSGEYSQQSQGTGAVQSAGTEFRYKEAQALWAVVATGTVDGTSFDGATGTVRIQRRVDVAKTR